MPNKKSKLVAARISLHHMRRLQELKQLKPDLTIRMLLEKVIDKMYDTVLDAKLKELLQ